ncbi:MAG: NAD-dependent epimerase/dehydratase family protein [Candidatus Bathyarchaeia archaeon]
MRVLVTGAAGFVGKHLTQKLLAEGHEVVAFDKRLCSLGTQTIQGDIAAYDFEGILGDIDVVFHLASLLGTAELFHRIVESARVNVLGTLNLLEAVRKREVKRIVFTSKPNMWRFNPYTITKETCERYLQMYQRVYGLRTVVVRPYNIYGPGEELTEYRKAIPYFAIAALRQEPLEIFGRGQQTMDAIYVDDAVEAIVRSSDLASDEIVEIGTSQPAKVIDIAKRIIYLAQSDSPIVHIPMRRGEGNTDKICANGNMKRLIGYSPKTTLDEGLQKTISWYSQHLDEFDNVYTLKKEDLVKNQ